VITEAAISSLQWNTSPKIRRFRAQRGAFPREASLPLTGMSPIRHIGDQVMPLARLSPARVVRMIHPADPIPVLRLGMVPACLAEPPGRPTGLDGDGGGPAGTRLAALLPRLA
jgi:hypothetical protein